MQIFIITDIFGITPAITRYARQLVDIACAVDIIDPYNGHQHNFFDEQIAYQHFNQNCAFEGYCTKIKTAVDAKLANSNSEDNIIIGFSVGAAAAWKAIADFAPKTYVTGVTGHSISHLIGFYPGQIRYHLDVQPVCPVTLIFPCSEQHFALDNVISLLSEKARVNCIKTPYFHGFMNPLSANYHAQAADTCFGLLTKVPLLTNGQTLATALNAELSLS